MNNSFLPVNREEMQAAGFRQLDFVYVSGDAYVDHPSFGAAIITRMLVAHGFSVGMICQPDWKDPESIMRLGEPRLAFLVSSGNMDSMVNHYTVAKKRRGTDAYSPGGKTGCRPDRAVTVYCNLIRRQYKKTPLIIGGIEASLRRLAHYDYWSDSVRRSILLESGADLISYGMGEKSFLAIAEALDAGIAVRDITFIPGTVFKTRNDSFLKDAVRLPDYESLLPDQGKKVPGLEKLPDDASHPDSGGRVTGKQKQIPQYKKNYAESIRIQYRNTDPFAAKPLYETYGGATYVVQNPPAPPLTTQELDDVYDRAYTYTYHPSYEKDGGIPALKEIRFSLTANRGCFGGCNFCALTFHEGRIVQARSHASVLREAKMLTQLPDFKGYIHDVGGPTAQFTQPACKKQLTKGACPDKACLFPKPCKNLEVTHKSYLQLLRRLRSLPGVEQVFVRSGIRFDYLMADPDRSFFRELCRYHISGQLRVAPEHISERVLRYMGKPSVKVYDAFVKEFERINEKTGKEQYLVPYLMSSHPGSQLADAVALAEYLNRIQSTPEQVQDFYPTPGTVSTCMYYTGLDPMTMEPVYVATDPHEKAMQRALIQYRKPENYKLVKEALHRTGRTDLIGYGRECLIPPRPPRYDSGKNRKAGSPQPGRQKAGKRGKTDHNKTSTVRQKTRAQAKTVPPKYR
ncbi:MAG: YgiQ family radical SAM protein [Eubacterium sp.]|nr:YgiQ family radical SAM protein [Eubacterium sp.]